MTAVLAATVDHGVIESVLLTVRKRHVEVTDSARSNGHGEVIVHDPWVFAVTRWPCSRDLDTGRVRKNLKLQLRAGYARVADGGGATARKEGQSGDDSAFLRPSLHNEHRIAGLIEDQLVGLQVELAEASPEVVEREGQIRIVAASPRTG
jgi:hypothetical protein